MGGPSAQRLELRLFCTVRLRTHILGVGFTTEYGKHLGSLYGPALYCIVY